MYYMLETRHPVSVATPSCVPRVHITISYIKPTFIFPFHHSKSKEKTYMHTKLCFRLVMANRSLVTFLFVLVSVAAYSATEVNGLGRMVGARMKVKDVKTNHDVQELGRHLVEEYDNFQSLREQHIANGSSEQLRFTEVVEAEVQVVSGIKYYLKVLVATPSGAPKTFDAIVVVKPWNRTKELIHFGPSAPIK